MKIFKSIFILLLFISSINISFGQKFSELDKSPADISYYRGKDKEPIVKVIYGRPQKKGRVIFGELEPYGKVWRTGANESTEIKFFKSVKFGGKEIKAGTYSLFSIPDKDKWTVIINSQTDQWGAYSYDAQKDVARVEVKPQSLTPELEILNIVFKDSEKTPSLVIAWDKVQVEVPLEVVESSNSSAETAAPAKTSK